MTVLKYWDVATGAYIPIVGQPGPPGARGPEGPQGDPGPGVPVGGITGDVLIKQSGTDYDTAWETHPADMGVLAAGAEDTATWPGIYLGTGDGPPLGPAGDFVLEVMRTADGANLLQRATRVLDPRFTASRIQTGGGWGDWLSPPAGWNGEANLATDVDLSPTEVTILNGGTMTVPAQRIYKLSALASGHAQGGTLTNMTVNLRVDGDWNEIMAATATAAGGAVVQDQAWVNGYCYRLFIGPVAHAVSITGVSFPATGSAGFFRCKANKVRLLVEDIGVWPWPVSALSRSS
jgi:hypothetical protein